MNQTSLQKKLVFSSFEDEACSFCVDVFLRVDHTFGYEIFRRDVEDQGRWQDLARYSSRVYTGKLQALLAAGQSVPWLAKNQFWIAACQAAEKADV